MGRRKQQGRAGGVTGASGRRKGKGKRLEGGGRRRSGRRSRGGVKWMRDSGDWLRRKLGLTREIQMGWATTFGANGLDRNGEYVSNFFSRAMSELLSEKSQVEVLAPIA